MAAFKVEEITRNRTVGWGVVEAGTKARAITTADCVDEKGNVNADFCKRFGIAPDAVNYITVRDLPKEYAESPRAALTKLAAEWSEGKDKDGKPAKWSPDDVMHYLVLLSRMQDAANASIKQHRPVSDKALDRATSTMVKTMKGNGKTVQEIIAVFAAMGTPVNEASVRETYGA